jgi:hypothetical protein
MSKSTPKSHWLRRAFVVFGSMKKPSPAPDHVITMPAQGLFLAESVDGRGRFSRIAALFSTQTIPQAHPAPGKEETL